MRRTGVILVALMIVACSDSDGPSANTEDVVTGEAIYTYPLDTLEDWVSYSDAVVVATVADEQRIAPGEGDAERVARGEGLLISRKLTVEIEQVLWKHPSIPELPQTFEFETTGWVLQNSQEVLFNYENHQRLEVGARYIIPLYASDGVGALARGAMPLDADGNVLASIDDSYVDPQSEGSDAYAAPVSGDDQAWIAELAIVELAGLSPAEIATKLAETAPNAVAEANRNLPLEERYQAVVEAGRAGA